jgi:3-oxoacyl-[acyl-carrier protein] reductase
MSTTVRVAIVTGGSRGIGRACAERLAADGCSVVIASLTKNSTDDAVATIRAAGGQAIGAQADVADPGDVGAVFDAATNEFGGVDVVVNAAGQMVLAPIATFDLDAVDRMFRTNVRGALVVNQQAALRVRPGGAIVNFSSSVTKIGAPTYGPYAATKGAVDAISLILARELRGRDITVNTVAPGPTATELFLDGKDDVTIQTLANANQLQRLGRPEDIAELVAFLAGPGRWVNGQVLYANGGMV